MKVKLFYLGTFLFFTIFFAACSDVQRIDTVNDDGKEVMALDYRDFDMVAGQMVHSILTSGVLNNPGGGRYVIATSEIANLTTQRIDTAQLTVKIEEEIINSQKAIITSALGSKDSIDGTVYDIREVRDSEYGDEFKEGTIAGKKQLIAPDLSLSGKIFQREIGYTNDERQREYYFQLRITDLQSGLRLWQKEILIGKRGSRQAAYR